MKHKKKSWRGVRWRFATFFHWKFPEIMTNTPVLSSFSRRRDSGFARIYIYIYVYIYMYIYMYIYVYIYMYIYIYTNMCVYYIHVYNNYITLHCIALRCITLLYITLHYITLLYIYITFTYIYTYTYIYIYICIYNHIYIMYKYYYILLPTCKQKSGTLPFSVGKSSIHGPFSASMLVHPRGIIIEHV